MRDMNRAVGYCQNAGCEEYSKGSFLLNQRAFACHRCHSVGYVEHEVGRRQNSLPIFKEVRVEFDFDARQKRYASTAIVRDESLWGSHNVYHYCTPMVKTEKQALRMAEQILATLNQMPELPEGKELPRFYENRLDWDLGLDAFKAHCKSWGESLEDTPLTRR